MSSHASGAEPEAALDARRPEIEVMLDELERSNGHVLPALHAAEAALQSTFDQLREPRAERVAG